MLSHRRQTCVGACTLVWPGATPWACNGQEHSAHMRQPPLRFSTVPSPGTSWDTKASNASRLHVSLAVCALPSHSCSTPLLSCRSMGRPLARMGGAYISNKPHRASPNTPYTAQIDPTLDGSTDDSDTPAECGIPPDGGLASILTPAAATGCVIISEGFSPRGTLRTSTPQLWMAPCTETCFVLRRVSLTNTCAEQHSRACTCIHTGGRIPIRSKWLPGRVDDTHRCSLPLTTVVKPAAPEDRAIFAWSCSNDDSVLHGAACALRCKTPARIHPPNPIAVCPNPFTDANPSAGLPSSSTSRNLLPVRVFVGTLPGSSPLRRSGPETQS